MISVKYKGSSERYKDGKFLHFLKEMFEPTQYFGSAAFAKFSFEIDYFRREWSKTYQHCPNFTVHFVPIQKYEEKTIGKKGLVYAPETPESFVFLPF